MSIFQIINETVITELTNSFSTTRNNAWLNVDKNKQDAADANIQAHFRTSIIRFLYAEIPYDMLIVARPSWTRSPCPL